MSHEAFLRQVAEAAGIEPRVAERAIEATLVTLGERIAAGEAADLARTLRERLTAPAVGSASQGQTPNG
jgi:uncharacterized protein (DUF2267 family)